jgi:hypothetical protein
MMGAEDIEAAPLLLSGVAGAPAEDVSHYLDKAVVPADETPLAEEQSAELADTVLDQQDDRGETEKISADERQLLK